jgi:putative dimethyl sulfoxide reductase chaperone
VDAARDRRAGEAVNGAVRQALSRAAVYRVLAAAFAYPGPRHVADVAGAAARAATAASAPVREALEALAQAARAADADALAEAYVALFDRQVSCPPYEGAYGVPQLGGKAMQLADIAGFYVAFGMTTGPQCDADDHIGAELEFMASLALKEAWAEGHRETARATIAKDAERAFLDDHLARWGEAFAARLLELAPRGLYAAAARLLTEWVREECARLAVVPRPLGGPAPADDAPLTCPMAAPSGPP